MLLRTPFGSISSTGPGLHIKESDLIKPLRKAVLPVAGLGTRFLPATKAMPKEMLPVVDKPLIQYAVDEARAAGIEQFCIDRPF
jgi:UTP--glucose-1-phosphate uridylyltransferase